MSDVSVTTTRERKQARPRRHLKYRVTADLVVVTGEGQPVEWKGMKKVTGQVESIADRVVKRRKLHPKLSNYLIN